MSIATRIDRAHARKANYTQRMMRLDTKGVLHKPKDVRYRRRKTVSVSDLNAVYVLEITYKDGRVIASPGGSYLARTDAQCDADELNASRNEPFVMIDRVRVRRAASVNFAD